MSAQMQEAAEMKTDKEKTPGTSESQPQPSAEGTAADISGSTDEFPSELELPRWSIVTFEGVAMSGLVYEEALKWLKKLDEQKISGLCIVTDEAAARISKRV